MSPGAVPGAGVAAAQAASEIEKAGAIRFFMRIFLSIEGWTNFSDVEVKD
jgi:hypothetical protein